VTSSEILLAIVGLLRTLRLAILVEGVYAGIVLQTRPQLLLATSFPIYCSLSIPHLSAVQFQQLKAFLNK